MDNLETAGIILGSYMIFRLTPPGRKLAKLTDLRPFIRMTSALYQSRVMTLMVITLIVTAPLWYLRYYVFPLVPHNVGVIAEPQDPVNFLLTFGPVAIGIALGPLLRLRRFFKR